jgi:mannitol-1-phosphate 5-dehydrogenase
MRSADYFFREKLKKSLPDSFPLDDQVGLVKTSIGKMVPIMTATDLTEDPLQVFAEPFNTLILDRAGFKGEIPHIKGFALKDNMKAWVDRKAFIHNLGHATAAYYGHLCDPEATYMYEVLSNGNNYRFTKEVMEESAKVLMAVYPEEFSWTDLTAEIDDLLTRFQNRNLGDTVFRVGSDLQRKLGRDDRFMGIIRMAGEVNKSFDLILKAMSMGFLFKANDEQGQLLPGDQDFHRAWEKDPDRTLKQVCGLRQEQDAALIRQLKQHIKAFTTG